ncbi:MAG TPA: hypothetical protein VG247_35165 [Pseudonocardiaceae bacterium]|jgi:hypothetical protein|nr:hypothetical protein [Pseudonocardiaceae bacterium]
MTAMRNEFAVRSAISSTELPEDLAAHAKAGVPRKVSRLLERAFYAPFVAATELAKRVTDGPDAPDLERFALFSVSNWDPSIPIPDYAGQDAPDLVERLSHFYTHPANPTDWLRRMPNNPLCNVCITTGFRGPTMHYTGGADALAMMATVAISTLANETASAAILVAFDLPDGDESLLAEQSDSTAAAVLLLPEEGPVLARELGAFAVATPPGTTAVRALDGFIEHSRAGVSR